MSKRRPTPTIADARQDDFFSVPPQPQHRPGSLNFSFELRAALSRALKECPLSRTEVAAKMTVLYYGDDAAQPLTKGHLDGWTAPSHEAWRFPLEFLGAFAEATQAFWLYDLVAEKWGGRFLAGDQVRLAELGAALISERQAVDRRRAAQKAIPPELLATVRRPRHA